MMINYEIHAGVVERVNYSARSFRLGGGSGTISTRPYDTATHQPWLVMAPSVPLTAQEGDEVVVRCYPRTFSVYDLEIVKPAAPPVKPKRTRKARPVVTTTTAEPIKEVDRALQEPSTVEVGIREQTELGTRGST